MKVRRFEWVDPTTYDESKFHELLSVNDGDWGKLVAVQTTWGILHYYDEDVVVIGTEINKDGTPREVLILPKEVLRYPKLK